MLSKLASWLSLDVTSGCLKRCSIFAFGITLTYVDEICQNVVVTSHLPKMLPLRVTEPARDCCYGSHLITWSSQNLYSGWLQLNMLKNSLLLWRYCSSYLQTQFLLPFFLIFCMDVFGCFSHDLPYFSTFYWCDWLWSCTISWTTCANIVSWWTLAGTCHWHSWFDKEKRWAWSWAEWSKSHEPYRKSCTNSHFLEFVGPSHIYKVFLASVHVSFWWLPISLEH